jgi:hypothetical protein
VGSYAPDPVEVSLTDVVRKAALDLKLQYERHGLSLEVEVDEDATLRQVDVHLVSLYVWSLAKFFLSCAPAQTTVSFRGLVAPNQNGGQSFVLIGSAPGIPEADVCVRTFSSEEAQGAFDHAFVFAKLIRTVAPLIKVSTTAAAQGNQLVIETAFEL